MDGFKILEVEDSNKIVEEFKKVYVISRAVCWNGKSCEFYPRAYSATVIALKTNEAFSEFKTSYCAT